MSENILSSVNSSVLLSIAFGELIKAETKYNENGSFSENSLLELYSLFGDVFETAINLVEKCKIIQYQTQSGRKIFKVIRPKEQYTVYDGINFCFCNFFHAEVLENQSALTCCHVLIAKLGTIMNIQSIESITDKQFVDFLNEQIYLLNEHTEDF
ncbi:unnamed protein product [Brassicogethes aeneus]|uniref:SWIM-type domain-containing protein n=1 Tax=Brassicogethes aeneus TaxID=1431903 RepID=A0A9P0FAA0_BRAAE|nr:unnamed protein product [Brassicogethes aeneus]